MYRDFITGYIAENSRVHQVDIIRAHRSILVNR